MLGVKIGEEMYCATCLQKIIKTQRNQQYCLPIPPAKKSQCQIIGHRGKAKQSLERHVNLIACKKIENMLDKKNENTFK